MAVVSTLIDRALRLIGEIGSGETPTDDEYSDAIISLNAMLESWRNEKLMCYAMQEETLTLSAGDSSYTLGPPGDSASTRPIAIERAWIVDSGNSYPVLAMNDAEYAAIPAKTTQSNWPDRFLFRPTMSTATLIVYPVPDSTRTLKLLTRVVLSSIGDETVSIFAPPGWDKAISYNLAIELAPEYGASVPPAVLKGAAESLASIKRANKFAQPSQAYTELGAMFSSGRGNIISGEV